MLTVKYFAYGSNILFERMKNRVSSFAHPLAMGSPYVLRDYNLVFNVGDYRPFANIVPCMGEFVEGVLYNLTPEQFDCLDKYEVLYNKYFFQIDINIIGCVYIASRRNINVTRNKPSLDYLNMIIDGCMQAGLSKTYNNLIQYKIRNYKLKKNKHSIL